MKQIYFLLSFICLSTFVAAQTFKSVQFASGSAVFPANFVSILQNPPVIQAAELFAGRFVRYIQFDRLLTDQERAMAEGQGLQFIAYYPATTYLVSLPEGFDFKRLVALPVQSVMAPVTNWKMAPQLLERPLGAWAVNGDLVTVNVQVYPHVGIENGMRFCAAAGLRVTTKGVMNGYLEVQVPISELLTVAAMPFIQYLELIAPPGEQEDTRNRSLHRGNNLDSDYPFGLHFNGAGVSALVRDDGKVGPHEDFRGRLTDLSTSNIGNHGDWVSGAMAGAGNIDPRSRGMATGAEIFVSEYVSSFQDDKLMQMLDAGVPITNTSYSDGCNLGYTLGSQTVDQQMVNQPNLSHVFSAGNSGTSNCNYGAGATWGNITGGHKMAKNAFAVANLLADGSLNNSSSRGPAYDGRIKPDISAHGTDVYMTQPFQTYSTATGTSFSAPAVAGALAQLTQAFKSLNNGQSPASALLKAAILNTALDIGNVGPDFRTGWGQINVEAAYRLLEQKNYTNATVSLGATNTQILSLPAQVRQARIMIVWTDPAAAPNAAKALVNDLDLKVIAPDGTVLLPWRLDPTPNATALNTPAKKGVDSLNNVEQVSIDQPQAGNYTVQVQGKGVVFGPQSYYLVWTYLKDALKITYPNGGEGFVSGQSETERIHWDAMGNTGEFNLQYSLDNGQNWKPIATVSAERRFYDWEIPTQTVSGQVKILIQRANQSDTTDYPFTIAPVPFNLNVEKVCPDSMLVSWKGPDTLEYDVYLLGQRYMEIVGHSKNLSLTFPIQNGGAAQWLSARTTDSTGLTGRRARAVLYPGNLKNCTQNNDVALRKLLSPAVDAIIQCGGGDQSIAVRIKNEGLNPVKGAIAHYQVGNQPALSELVPEIPVADSVDFVFSTPYYIGFNGRLNLKVWLTYPEDNAHYNDTIQRFLPVVSQSVQTTFGENFENSPNLPSGWTVVNPDDQIGWELQRGGTVGASGTNTRAFKLACYDYPVPGALDYIYLVPLDLSNIANPTLFFDLAYAQYDELSSEALRVEIFENCDLNASPVVLWQKEGAELATRSSTTGSFTPANASDWSSEAVNLKPYAGKSVLLRFASLNNYGNNMYIDNVRLLNSVAAVPNADFIVSTDTVCRLDTMQFLAVSQDLSTTNLSWNFGLQAQPATATGPGPHNVWYVTPGSKNVRLIASNPFGIDTLVQKIVVRSFPTANFSTQVVDLTVAFTNTSQNATSFFWDFGDGQTSTQAEPLHTYAAPGSYTVKLRATNPCKTIEKTATVLTVVKTDELSKSLNVSILPNPTSGDFKVNLQLVQPLGDVRLRLLDAQGRQIKVQKMTLKQGENMAAFEGLQLPKGVYQLMVDTNVGVKTLKVVVE
jgi:PKD repeat protein